MINISNVTVVIPLYNKEPFIKRTLCSVLNQTFKQFEVIVVDDGSTDNSVEVVKNINDSRIHLIQQENMGVSAARNRGIKEARSGLIAFIDADDEWKPEFLNTVVSLAHKYPEAGAFAASYLVVNENGVVKHPNFFWLPENFSEGIIQNYFKAAFKDSLITSSSVLIPKHIFKHVGNFPEGIKSGEDLHVWAKISLAYPIAFTTRQLVKYRKDSMYRACLKSTLDFEDFSFLNDAKILKNITSEEKKLYLKEYFYKRQLDRASLCITIGNKTLAAHFIKQAKQTKKSKIRLLILQIINSKIFTNSISRIIYIAIHKIKHGIVI